MQTHSVTRCWVLYQFDMRGPEQPFRFEKASRGLPHGHASLAVQHAYGRLCSIG